MASDRRAGYDRRGSCRKSQALTRKPFMNRSHVAFLAIMAIVTGSTAADGSLLRYELLPGSTITPYAGTPIPGTPYYDVRPSGPAEPLTGTFEWGELDDNSGFNAVALFFSSPSFSLSLNDTALNGYETFVSPSSSLTNFGEIVDTRGLSIATGQIFAAAPGSYLGTTSLPTFLSYPDLAFGPYGAGTIVAHITFSARLVPEPSTLALAALGALGLLIAARRRRHMNPR